MKPGDRLGPYEVLGKLGEGGMGEVYKARDTRLDRTVAVKVLAEAVAADREPAGPVRTRSAGDRGAVSPAHLHRSRRGASAGQRRGSPRRLHRHGISRRRNARRSTGADSRPAADRSGADDWRRGRRRPRQGAPRRHRPSRSQAGQRDADEVGAQAARLRAGENDCEEWRATTPRPKR